MSDKITGTCLCGSVQYSTHIPTLFCSHCHCRFCRHAHGAAFVTWFGVPEDTFAITSGETTLRWFQSSRHSRRGFCADCGTTLFFVSLASPGEIHIALATSDGPIDREPQGHIFFDQRAAWFEPRDDLPRVNSDDDALAHYGTVGT